MKGDKMAMLIVMTFLGVVIGIVGLLGTNTMTMMVLGVIIELAAITKAITEINEKK